MEKTSSEGFLERTGMTGSYYIATCWAIKSQTVAKCTQEENLKTNHEPRLQTDIHLSVTKKPHFPLLARTGITPITHYKLTPLQTLLILHATVNSTKDRMSKHFKF